MVPFIPKQPLSPREIVAATRAMLVVARADGIHEAEVELIRRFYEGAGNGAVPEFEALLGEPGDSGAIDAAVFEDVEHRELVVALCVMAGYADGAMSEAELAAIRSAAKALGVAQTRLAEIIEGVKDHMVAQLAHLPEAASVAKVVRELG